MFFDKERKNTIQRIKARYLEANKKLIAFQCPSLIKDEYKQVIEFTEIHVSNLLSYYNKTQQESLNNEQLNQVNLDSLKEEVDFQIRLKFLQIKVDLLLYIEKASLLISKGQNLITQRIAMGDLPILYWLSDNITETEFSVQGKFGSLHKEFDELQKYNTKTGDMFLSSMAEYLTARMKKSITALETFCTTQELFTKTMPEMSKKLTQAIDFIYKLSTKQQNSTQFIEDYSNTLKIIIKTIDQHIFDLSSLDNFIEDLKKEYEESLIKEASTPLSPRNR